MLDDTRRFFRELVREHRLLLVLLGLALLRLLTHVDHYLTVRDLDFFPAELQTHLSPGYRGGQPLALWLNWRWSRLAGEDALLVKQIFAKAYVVLYVPIFVSMARRFGQDTRTAAVSLFLFLTGSVTFALYDTLGPYFLLLLATGLQLVFLADVVEGTEPFWKLCAVSVLALVCHRNGIVTTGFSLAVVAWYRRKALVEPAWNVLLGLALAAWVGLQLRGFLELDRDARGYQLDVHPPHLFDYRPGSMGDTLAAALQDLPALFSRLVGVDVGMEWLAVVAATVLAVIVWRARGTARRVAYVFFLGCLVLAVMLVVSTRFMAADLFCQPNHATYNSLLVPFLFLFVGGALSQLRSGWLRAGIIVLLVAVNLWTGYRYRGEAFDLPAYQASLEARGAGSSECRLIPSFVPDAYFGRFSDGNGRRPSAADERRWNDFTRIDDREFCVDVIEYNELGVPFFAYPALQHRLEEVLRAKDYRYVREPFRTFVRYRAWRD